MNRTLLLSTTALLFGATAAFAHQDVVSTKAQNGLVMSIITNAPAATQFVKPPDLFVAYDFGNLNTKYSKAEYTPWEAYIFCGASETVSVCNHGTWAFPFTSGATLALAKIAGYQVAMQNPSGYACPTANFTVELYTNAGTVPGVAVAGTASGTLTATSIWGTAGSPTVNKTFKKAVQLTPSTAYWAVAAPTATSCVAWDVQDTDYVDGEPAAFGNTAATAWSTGNFGDIGPALGVVR